MKPSNTHQQSENSYLTQNEAAELLRLSARTLERWRVEGIGPSYRRFGRRVVYARSDLDHWANGCTRQSTSQSLATSE